MNSRGLGGGSRKVIGAFAPASPPPYFLTTSFAALPRAIWKLPWRHPECQQHHRGRIGSKTTSWNLYDHHNDDDVNHHRRNNDDDDVNHHRLNNGDDNVNKDDDVNDDDDV
jgi:hypothetical protein